MQKHLTHVIDEQAVHIFKGLLPPEHWTVYNLTPDRGKDHQVELIESGEHTARTFWVQLKGQRRVTSLGSGSISFRLETKDLDYFTKLPEPMFLIVVDVTKGVGYWIFIQEYERTRLKNVTWRGQKHIQIHLPVVNCLSDQGLFRDSVKKALSYMIRSSFDKDLGAEQQRLTRIDPRFTVNIWAGTGGRHYKFHTDEIVPIEFSYAEGSTGTGKIEEMVDSGNPIVAKKGEIRVSGSPLFEYFSEMAGDGDLCLEVNKTVDGHAILLRSDKAGGVKSKIDAIPCKIICGQREARIEAALPFGLISLKTTIPYETKATRPMFMPIDLSAWQERCLMDLPFFDQLAGLFVDLGVEERFTFECFAPGQRIFGGTIDFDEDQPHQGISFLIEMLGKARAIAARCGVNPKLPKGYETGRSLYEIQMLHDMLIGEGRRRLTTSAKVGVTIEREELRRFLADVEGYSSLGTLNLNGNGSFPFLDESIRIEALESVLTNMLLINDRGTLQDELDREPNKKLFRLNWEATEATETTLRERRSGEAEHQSGPQSRMIDALRKTGVGAGLLAEH